MKKILTANIALPNANLPIVAPGLDFLQAQAQEINDAVGKALIGNSYDATKYYVLFGVNDTVAGPSHTLSNGLIFFNGEFIKVTGAVINPIVTLITIAITKPFLAGTDPIAFTDGSGPFNVHQDTIGTVVDHAADATHIDVAALIYFNAWQVIGVGAAPGFQNAWQNAAGGDSTKFKYDYNNHVEFNGTLDSTAGASGSVAFTLPAGYRPKHGLTIVAAADANNSKSAYISIATTGAVTVFYTAAAAFVSVTGCRFSLD